MSDMEHGTDPYSRKATGLVNKVLGDPTLYPDEFKAWIPRWVSQNVNFTVQQQQLPPVQRNNVVGSLGAAAFENGWAGTAAYYTDPFKRIYLDGLVSGGSIGNPVFTLPVGNRPQNVSVFVVVSNNAFGICTVNPGGSVVATAGSNLSFSLAGISFRQYN